MGEQKKLALRTFRTILITIIVSTIVCAMITIGVYFKKFHSGLSDIPSDWEAFGGYVGGTLGAIFGLASFFALLFTIYMQREELDINRQALEDSRKELARSAKAQELTEIHLKSQLKLSKIQIFENKFFELINSLIRLQDDIYRERYIQNGVEIEQTIFKFFAEQISSENIEDAHDKSLSLPVKVQLVFNTIYIIMELVQDSHEKDEASQKYYISILKKYVHTVFKRWLIIHFLKSEYASEFGLSMREFLSRYHFFDDLGTLVSSEGRPLRIFQGLLKFYPPEAFNINPEDTELWEFLS